MRNIIVSHPKRPSSPLRVITLHNCQAGGVCDPGALPLKAVNAFQWGGRETIMIYVVLPSHRSMSDDWMGRTGQANWPRDLTQGASTARCNVGFYGPTFTRIHLPAVVLNRFPKTLTPDLGNPQALRSCYLAVVTVENTNYQALHPNASLNALEMEEASSAPSVVASLNPNNICYSFLLAH